MYRRNGGNLHNPKKVMKIMSLREEWLSKAVELINEQVFVPNDLRLPPVTKISCGDCRGKAVGTCFSPEASDDGTCNIFITPKLGNNDVMEILGTIAHEMVHAHCFAEGYLEHGHGHPFSKIIRVVGLEGSPRTAGAREGTELYATLEGIAATLGDYPHAPIRNNKEPKTRKKGAIKFVSSTNIDYVVKVKKELVEEFGPPKDYNGEPMVPEKAEEMTDDESLGLDLAAAMKDDETTEAEAEAEAE